MAVDACDAIAIGALVEVGLDSVGGDCVGKAVAKRTTVAVAAPVSPATAAAVVPGVNSIRAVGE